MEIHQLRYFLAVARAGSFVRAAEEEGVTQPSLSQQIKKLETELGVPLLDRLGRSVRLTRYGEALRPEAESLLRQMRLTRKTLEAMRAEGTGVLVAGVIPTILPYSMIDVLASFRALYPKVDLDIRELTTERMIEGLRAGELDLAVVALPIRHKEIVCSELFREPLVAALPPNHPLANENVIDLSCLTEERMLLLREGHCLRDEVLTTCSRANAQFVNTFESDHLSSIFAMVAGGFGISLVPEFAARRGAAGCKILPIQPKAFRRVGYAQAAGHCSLPVQKTFVKFLRNWTWPVGAAKSSGRN